MLGSASQLTALMTELETAALKLHHLFPSRCVVGSCCQNGCRSTSAHSHRHRVGWKRGPAHPQTTSRARGTVVFLLLTQAAPREEVPDQSTCSHGLVGSCLPGGGPPQRMGHAVTFRGAEYLLCPGGFGTNILTWSSEQPV